MSRNVVSYWTKTQQQWLRETKLTACTRLKVILLDVPGETRIITELSDSGSFFPSFFVNKDGLMCMHVTPTVCTDFAHTREERATEEKE